MEEIIGRHALLLESSSRETASQHAHHFLDHNQLVRYDSVFIENDTIISAVDHTFFGSIEAGLKANRQTISKLVKELQVEGAADPRTWSALQQGYTSKLLHTVIHLLDGFFGIDSALYNLIENSHQVTDTLMSRMEVVPEKYWLVRVKGLSARGDADRVPLLRPFGRETER
jgi:hypothetical protein